MRFSSIRLGMPSVSFLVLAAAVGAGVSTTEAAFPGLNGKIIFTSFRDTGTFDLFTMTPAGANQTNLNPSPRPEFWPNYSSDGARIAFTRDFLDQNEIVRMNADASGQIVLTGPGSFNTTPVWSPSGAFIAWSSNRTGSSDIWVMTSDGVLEFPVTFSPEAEFDPAWSPDGNRIAFTRGASGMNQEIVVLTLFPFGTTVITNDPGDDRAADWSPDGTKITFVSDRDGDLDVYVMNADGSSVVQLTNDPGIDNVPAWSPDGSLIAFTSNRASPVDVYVMNADGSGTPTRLTTSGDGNMPGWQPLPPAAATQLLRAEVSALVDSGTLNHGNGNALDQKLEGAIEKMQQLNVQPAINKLQAFVNQTNAFLNAGKLTLAEGQTLLDAAQTIIDYVSANGLPSPIEPEIIDVP